MYWFIQLIIKVLMNSSGLLFYVFHVYILCNIKSSRKEFT
jgi:hypothetical protein